MYNNSRNCRGMVYVVKDGDTLYKIAREYDLKLIDVLVANPYVNVYNLQPGDELCLPTFPNRRMQDGNTADRNRISDDTSASESGNDQNMQIYQIREGDTLSDILNYFQTDYDELLTWNPALRDVPIPLGIVVRFPN